MAIDFTRIASYQGGRYTGTGGGVAIYGVLPVRRHLWLQPEVSIAGKQLVVEYRSTESATVPFVELAALAVAPARLGAGRGLVFVGAGPALAFAVEGIPRLFEPYGSPWGSETDKWRKTNIELVVAAGVSWNISQRIRLRFDVRRLEGLRDLDPMTAHNPRLTSWQLGWTIAEGPFRR